MTTPSGKFAPAPGVTSGTLNYLQGLTTNVQAALTNLSMTSAPFACNIGDGTNPLTTSFAFGFYQKWGSIVFVEMRFTWTGFGNAVPSAPLIASLPFAAGPCGASFTIGRITGSYAFARADSGQDRVLFSLSDGISFTVANLDSSGTLQLSGTYRINP